MHQTKSKDFTHVIEGTLTGVGAFLGLSFIGLIAQSVHQMLIIAPFGATAVLLFSAPESQFSKPWNVLASYSLSTIIGFLILHYSNGEWLAIGGGFGIVIMLMHAFKAIHPPAGANFLIVTQGHISLYLLSPLLLGLITLIIIGIGLHKIRKKITFM
ncbi:MAG: HPP family protein [Sulfuricurvum sp.]|uniref:HPP family protein n=1 Tax=Sulfuricurvum sp. TaxID=2025608 RepID=UPI002638D60B|nr:HPP family protein [Sulfuricurvum sp.]MDD5160541.1 HPP family protein [Sulfuricurvum sp.]